MEDIKKLEERLEIAADKLGKLIASQPKENKKRMQEIVDELTAYAEDAKKDGKYFDKSALFAVAIISEPNFANDIKEAAKEYIDIDWELIKANN